MLRITMEHVWNMCGTCVEHGRNMTRAVEVQGLTHWRPHAASLFGSGAFLMQNNAPARGLKATLAPSGNSALKPAGRVAHTHHIMVLPFHMLTYSYLPSPSRSHNLHTHPKFRHT